MGNVWPDQRCQPLSHPDTGTQRNGESVQGEKDTHKSLSPWSVTMTLHIATLWKQDGGHILKWSYLQSWTALTLTFVFFVTWEAFL